MAKKAVKIEDIAKVALATEDNTTVSNGKRNTTHAEMVTKPDTELAVLEGASDKEVLDAFIQNPEMKKQAGTLAFEIQKEFTNWFSIPQIVKKFQTETTEAAKKIEMLMLFNYCIGKVEKGKPFFKIDIDHRAQRRLIMEEIAEYEGKILFLKEKLGKLD